MDKNIEYIIVGGPQHGAISRHACKADAAPLALPTSDGQLCAAAARRRDGIGTRYLLLHPGATGEQFLSMLVA
jgi:hypothetical protein